METRYPDWDVMRNADHWDEKTANLVQGRLSQPGALKFFNESEARLLSLVCMKLLADSELEPIVQVVAHIDKKLAEGISDGYRKVGLPKETVLYQEGLLGVNETAQIQCGKEFSQLTERQQTEVLKAVADGQPQGTMWKRIPAKEFFKRLLKDAVEMYCSLPSVWSEMGYAGPAYPRGYVRIELGATDPWEAKEAHD